MAASSRTAPEFLRLAAHPLRWRLLTELADSDLRVRELVTLTGEPQNLISYHLRLLRAGGLVTVSRSSFDGRDSYYHLDLERCAVELSRTGAALHPGLHPGSGAPARRQPGVAVLFICTGNSGRSPIAEALLRHHTGGQAVAAVSAGSHPRPCLHPNAVRALREGYDIDIAEQRPRHLDTLTGRRFDYVITMCDRAREVCPEFAGDPRRLHWSIPDPARAGDSDRASYPAFARAVADIDTRVRHLLPVLTTRPPNVPEVEP